MQVFYTTLLKNTSIKQAVLESTFRSGGYSQLIFIRLPFPNQDFYLHSMHSLLITLALINRECTAFNV